MSIPRPAVVRQAPDSAEAMHSHEAAQPVGPGGAQAGDADSLLDPVLRMALEQRAPGVMTEDRRFDAMRAHVAAALDQNCALGEIVAATPPGMRGLMRTAVMTAEGEVALASRHGPVRPAISTEPVHHVLRHYLDDPTVGVHPGDAFLFAEPVPDADGPPAQGLLMPCFHERRLVAWVACAMTEAPIEFSTDPATGSATESAIASTTEARARAARRPGRRSLGPAVGERAAGWPHGWQGCPIKVAEGWQLKADLLAAMRQHGPATSHATANLHAWLATCTRLCESLHGHLEHHGADWVAGMLQHALDRVAHTVADRLQTLPEATVRGSFYLQGAPHEAALFKLEISLCLKGPHCTVDLRGSAGEISNRGLNLTLARTRQCLVDALIGTLWTELPHLPAVLRPFDFLADPASLLACSDGVPTGSSGRTRAALVQAFSRLLAKLGGLGPLGERGAARARPGRRCEADGPLQAAGCGARCGRATCPDEAESLALEGVAAHGDDPLATPPDQVLAELQRGRIGAQLAWRLHGVVLQPSGTGVDLLRTRAERDARRQARRRSALPWHTVMAQQAAAGPAPGVPFFGRWNAESLLYAGLQRALPGQFDAPVVLLEPAALQAACAGLAQTQAATAAAGLARRGTLVRPGSDSRFIAPLSLAACSRLLHLAWRALGVAWRASLSLPWERPADAAARRQWQQQRLAQAVCQALRHLGPIPAKLARLAAGRPDWVGSEMAAQLSLHMPRVALLPPHQAMRIAERGLGGPLRELFLRFDRVPLATGALTQVHGAVLADGRRCSVKVKRPGLEAALAADLGALAMLSGLLEWCPGRRVRQAGQALRQLGQAIQSSASFTAEAGRHAHWAQALAGHAGLRMPQTVPQFCSDTVITLEFVAGVTPATWLERHGGRDPAMARRLYQMGWCLQISGCLLHAGPHAGHLLIDDAGRLVLLDTSLLSRIEPAAALRWMRACMAAIAGDAGLWLAALAADGPAGAAGCRLAPRQGLALQEALQEHLQRCSAVRDRGTGALWLGLLRRMQQHGAPLDEVLQRAMAADIAMAELAQLLDPGFDAAGFFHRELPRLAVERGPLRADDPFVLAATRRDLRPAIRTALEPRFMPPRMASMARTGRTSRSTP